VAPNWDYYKVRKSESRRLTRSTKSKDGFRGLIHGKKGVSQQAEFFRVDRREATGSRGAGSGFPTVLGFAAKVVLVLGAIGTVLLLAGWVLSTLFTAAGAGLDQLNAWLSAHSLLVAVGVNVIVWTALAVLGVKVARFVGRWRQQRLDRLERRERQAAAHAAAVAEALAARAEVTRVAYSAASIAAVPADWYPDPTNPVQLRYWDGRAWTNSVHAPQVVSATPADWYPDPSSAAQLRYWDGAAWTSSVAPMPGAAPVQRPAARAGMVNGSASANAQPPVSMTSDEWQQQFRAWMAVGAIEWELWTRLINARISDADERTIDAQAQLRQLTPEEGAQRIRLAIEANPGLRQDLRIDEFLAYVLVGGRTLTDEPVRKSVGQARGLQDTK